MFGKEFFEVWNGSTVCSDEHKCLDEHLCLDWLLLGTIDAPLLLSLFSSRLSGLFYGDMHCK